MTDGHPIQGICLKSAQGRVGQYTPSRGHVGLYRPVEKGDRKISFKLLVMDSHRF